LTYLDLGLPSTDEAATPSDAEIPSWWQWMTPFHVLTIGSTTILIIYFFTDTSNRDIATQIDKRMRKEHGSFSNAFTGKAGGQPLICRTFVGLPNYSWHMFLCAIAFGLDAVNYSVRCWQASECTLGDESACVFKNSGGEMRCF
jgi:hypothetical protein